MEKDYLDYSEWRADYPDGTRILWEDRLDTKRWLPGVISGERQWNGQMILLFRLDTDPPRARLPHLLSFRYRHLIKRQNNDSVGV